MSTTAEQSKNVISMRKKDPRIERSDTLILEASSQLESLANLVGRLDAHDFEGSESSLTGILDALGLRMEMLVDAIVTAIEDRDNDLDWSELGRVVYGRYGSFGSGRSDAAQERGNE